MALLVTDRKAKKKIRLLQDANICFSFAYAAFFLITIVFSGKIFGGYVPSENLTIYFLVVLMVSLGYVSFSAYYEFEIKRLRKNVVMPKSADEKFKEAFDAFSSKYDRYLKVRKKAETGIFILFVLIWGCAIVMNWQYAETRKNYFMLSLLSGCFLDALIRLVGGLYN